MPMLRLALVLALVHRSAVAATLIELVAPFTPAVCCSFINYLLYVRESYRQVGALL